MRDHGGPGTRPAPHSLPADDRTEQSPGRGSPATRRKVNRRAGRCSGAVGRILDAAFPGRSIRNAREARRRDAVLADEAPRVGKGPAPAATRSPCCPASASTSCGEGGDARCSPRRRVLLGSGAPRQEPPDEIVKQWIACRARASSRSRRKCEGEAANHAAECMACLRPGNGTSPIIRTRRRHRSAW